MFQYTETMMNGYIIIRPLPGARRNRGVTLIELMFVLFIFSIVGAVLLSIYIYGIKLFDTSSTLHQMFAEGTAVLDRMERFILNGDSVYVHDASDPNRTQLDVVWPGYTSETVKYFYNSQDKSLRKNDLRTGVNDYNVPILPMEVGGGHRQTGAPFHVKTAHFQMVENDFGGSDNWTVRVDLVLEDNKSGDTIALSSTVTKRTR